MAPRSVRRGSPSLGGVTPLQVPSAESRPCKGERAVAACRGLPTTAGRPNVASRFNSAGNNAPSSRLRRTGAASAGCLPAERRQARRASCDQARRSTGLFCTFCGSHLAHNHPFVCALAAVPSPRTTTITRRLFAAQALLQRAARCNLQWLPPIPALNGRFPLSPHLWQASDCV